MGIGARSGGGTAGGSSGGGGRPPLLAPLALFTGLLTLKLLVARSLALRDPNPLRALVLEGGFALLVLATVGLAARKGRLWAWLAADAAVSLVVVAVLMHVREFAQLPTVGALAAARELPEVGGAVWASLRPAYALLFADVAALAVLFAVTSRRRPAAGRRFDPRLLAALGVAAAWASIPVTAILLGPPVDDSLAGARRGGLVAFAIADPGDRGEIDLGGEPYLRTVAATREPTASVETEAPPPVKAAVDFERPETVQARFDYLQDYRGSGRVAGAPSPGIAAGRSVVMVQMEALGTWVVGATVDGKEITPYLNRLVRESWYAPRTVTQIGRGNTSDAEFTANTSLLADRAKPSGYKWGDREIPSLPRLVRKRGYQAITLHTNEVTYWRRDALYPALGFTRAYDQYDFPQREIIGPGPSDRILFDKAADVIGKLHAEDKPFLVECVTLSAHFPYYAVARKSDFEVPLSMRWRVLGEYLQGMNYQDQRLGEFVERLRAEGVLDDAVLVIYGDHFGVRPFGKSQAAHDDLTDAERTELERILGREPAVTDNYLIPLIVRVPGQTQGRRVERLRGQVDIMPTVAELLGIDLAGTAHVGASIFDDRARAVCMRYHTPNGTFMTDEYLFRPGAGYDDAAVWRLSDSERVPPKSVPHSQYKRLRSLGALTAAYLNSMPKRD